MSNAEMAAGRIRLAQAARHLIYGHPRDYSAIPIPPHTCGLICVRPLVFGRAMDESWDSLTGSTIYGELDVHRLKLVKVWAMPILGWSIDLTRYVCR